MPARYFEEYEVGEVMVHTPSRTVTEYDNVQFCAMTMNPQSLHVDAEFAKTTVHGKPLVNGMYTLSLILGLSVNDTTQGRTLGNLGMTDIEFPKPVFAGDTITAETTILGMRLSKSRPGTGIVDYEHRARNQKGDVVVKCKRSGLIMCKPSK